MAKRKPTDFSDKPAWFQKGWNDREAHDADPESKTLTDEQIDAKNPYGTTERAPHWKEGFIACGKAPEEKPEKAGKPAAGGGD